MNYPASLLRANAAGRERRERAIKISSAGEEENGEAEAGKGGGGGLGDGTEIEPGGLADAEDGISVVPAEAGVEGGEGIGLGGGVEEIDGFAVMRGPPNGIGELLIYRKRERDRVGDEIEAVGVIRMPVVCAKNESGVNAADEGVGGADGGIEDAALAKSESVVDAPEVAGSVVRGGGQEGLRDRIPAGEGGAAGEGA